MQNIYTRLINEKHPLPSDYIPENLIDAGIPFHALQMTPNGLWKKMRLVRPFVL